MGRGLCAFFFVAFLTLLFVRSSSSHCGACLSAAPRSSHHCLDTLSFNSSHSCLPAHLFQSIILSCFISSFLTFSWQTTSPPPPVPLKTRCALWPFGVNISSFAHDGSCKSTHQFPCLHCLQPCCCPFLHLLVHTPSAAKTVDSPSSTSKPFTSRKRERDRWFLACCCLNSSFL